MADCSSCYGYTTLTIRQYMINILEVGVVHYVSPVSITTVQNTQTAYCHPMSPHTSISHVHYNYITSHYIVTNTDAEH